ncbi:TPA: efflux RND transporter periplasmic adaptor subunit [Enterobacter cloacae]|uniref:efflux RND transporter periplasmic adaptor subunit n=1 Tax=Enterobacter cloacae TaxID=550 RepID=UPI00300EE6DA|nr:efflux RND transporter periplasmic adaptor subunit [Enterobacter cloacae]
MKHKSRWVMLGCGLAFAAAMAGVWVSMASPSPHTRLPVDTVGTGDIEKVVLVTGILKPAVQVNVGAQVNGQLRKLYVRQGERVKKGQLLAEIDPTLQESELRNTKAQLASARAQKRSAQAMLLRYRQELDRQRLMQRDGSGVRSEFEQARSQYAVQVQQIAVSEAQIAQAEMAVKTAQANLSYTRIVAPVDGEVLGIVTREGQTIVSSQTAPTILVLADLDTMQVQTRISEADVQKIHPGQPLSFYVIANPDKRYASTMGYVQPAPQDAMEASGERGMGGNAQAMAVYYTGTFEVPNAGRELKTSMTAQVFIQIARASNVLRVPVAALGQAQDADRYTITTVKDGNTQSRTIRIGIQDRQYAEVLEGLQAGEQVVLEQETERG